MFTLCQLNPFQYDAIEASIRLAVQKLIGIRKRYGRDSQSFLRMALLVAQVGSSIGREFDVRSRVTAALSLYDGSIVDDAVESGKLLFGNGKAGLGTLVDAVLVKCSSLLADGSADAISSAKQLISETLAKAECS